MIANMIVAFEIFTFQLHHLLRNRISYTPFNNMYMENPYILELKMF